MILVTGATGNVGRELVPMLVEAKQDVRILVRDERKAGAWRGRRDRAGESVSRQRSDRDSRKGGRRRKVMSETKPQDTTYHPERDPQMMRYWMQHGPRTAAFLLVIPGCVAIGYGVGLLAQRPLPWAIIGGGAGLLAWGLIVALTP
jgi:hypothetical protein